MSSPAEDNETAELREKLAGVPGVEQVVVDQERDQIWLLLRANVDAQRAEEAARSAAGGHDWQISVAYRPEHRDRQRVRFVELRRNLRADQRIDFAVTLEWAGEEFVGDAVGEKGPAIELRTTATAALAAVAALVPGEMQIKLAGVKLVRAFDAELVVVSLYRPDAVPHNLVGAVVAGDDAPRAAAAAVLSALNRLLGNYLALS